MTLKQRRWAINFRRWATLLGQRRWAINVRRWAINGPRPQYIKCILRGEGSRGVNSNISPSRVAGFIEGRENLVERVVCVLCELAWLGLLGLDGCKF